VLLCVCVCDVFKVGLSKIEIEMRLKAGNARDKVKEGEADTP